jgi:hypothetical protein
VGVTAEVGLGDDTAQAPARVEHAEGQLLVRAALDELIGDQLEQVGLAAFNVAEDQQVLVGLEEIEEERGEGVLVDADADGLRFGGQGEQLGRGQPGGQDADGGGDVAVPA